MLASRPLHRLTTALTETLRDRRLALLLGALLALLTLAAQVPRSYSVPIGRADGPGSDLPLLSGYYGPERDPRGAFRWSSARASVELPGTGQRAMQATLRVLPLGDVADRAPKVLELWSNGRELGLLPVTPRGAVYRFLVPAPPDGGGDQQIELRSATFDTGDPPRALGVPVGDVRAVGGGLALPAWRSTLLWLAAALLLWLAVRRAGFGARAALALLAPLALLLGVAAALDPPRTALGAPVFLTALALGALLVAVLRAAVPPLAARLALPLDARALRWLLLLALVVFAMRYGGKTYPSAMEGDIGFHVNRFTDVVAGKVMLLSKNRGVDFPYPPALYLLLAPFTLVGLTRAALLHGGGALLDALSPLLVYAIAVRFTIYDLRSTIEQGVASNAAPRHPVSVSPRHPVTPLLAAGIYALSASGFMTTWWNFSTHIFTQFAHLLLMAAVVLWWSQGSGGARPGGMSERDTGSVSCRASPAAVIAVLFTLQLLVYLGHFGFWINTTLLGGIGLAALLAGRCWAGRRWDARAWTFALTFGAAQAAAALWFYSAYTGLFIAQVQAAARGGLTGLAGRAPIALGVLWALLWDAGLRVHFGFFPVPLALAGLLLFRGQETGDRGQGTETKNALVLVLLVGGTFAIALVFAALPFLSGSTLSTRWLLFSAWAISVAAALALHALWRCGRAGRLVVVAVCSYVVWVMASQWLLAMIWRVRPPEPF